MSAELADCTQNAVSFPGDSQHEYLRPGKHQFSYFASPRGELGGIEDRVPVVESRGWPSVPGALILFLEWASVV